MYSGEGTIILVPRLNCFVGVRKHTFRQADRYFTHNYARNLNILMKKKPEEKRTSQRNRLAFCLYKMLKIITFQMFLVFLD